MILNRTFLLCFVCIFAVLLATVVPGLSWLSPLTCMIILPAAVFWIWKSEGRSLWELGFRFGQRWTSRLAIGLVSGLAIPIFFLAVQLLASWISLVNRVDPIKGIVSSLLLFLLRMILVVAIEELVFRGFFFQALNQKTGFWLAIVLSSLLWGLGHLTTMVNDGLSPVSIIIGMTSFLMWGITLALCYLRAGKSLWLPYGLHLGANISFSLIGLPFIVQPNAPQWWIGNPAWSPESGLIGVVVWLIFAVIMYWLTGSKKINAFTENS
jgi:membrane protease YdiL (CAAX protease family)